MKKLNQKGSHLLAIILMIAVAGLIGLAGWQVYKKQKDPQASSSTTQTNTQADASANSDITWEGTSENTWIPIGGTPPACPEPFTIASPSPQLMKATSILMPGSERRGSFEGAGGNYKPHGAFRFDNSKPADIKVVVPINGYLYRGSRYLVDNEIQYTFDFIHPCGYMVRVGHLRELSPTYQAIADKFPAAIEGDSRTERVEPKMTVKAGDEVATASGFYNGNNVFFDLGVFDLRKTNEASKDSAYQAKHADTKHHTWYAVCWFDMLPKTESDFVKNLPAGDPANGKNSDYCK